jgi:hypothetical protein
MQASNVMAVPYQIHAQVSGPPTVMHRIFTLYVQCS